MSEIAIVEGKSLQALAAELGGQVQQSDGPSQSRLPELKINSQMFDDDENQLPMGEFFIKGMEKKVFAKTVKFRPLAHHFQYLHYSNAENKLVNKTRLITSFRQEARDIRGGIKCGKPTWKELQGLSEDQRAKYDEITCFRQVRGLVSYTGKTLDGEEVTIENQPVILMLKKSNFNGFEDQYLKVIPKNRNIWDFNATLTAERHKNGSVIWYTFVFTPDLKDPLALDQDTYDSMAFIADMIREENASIDEKYEAALREDSIDGDAIEALGDSLDDDFEDVA